MAKPVIVIVFKPEERVQGTAGGYYAYLKDRPGINELNKTKDEVLRQMMLSTKAAGLSNNLADYDIEE